MKSKEHLNYMYESDTYKKDIINHTYDKIKFNKWEKPYLINKNSENNNNKQPIESLELLKQK